MSCDKTFLSHAPWQPFACAPGTRSRHKPRGKSYGEGGNLVVLSLVDKRSVFGSCAVCGTGMVLTNVAA